MKSLMLTALGMAVLGFTLIGCSQEARESYGEAGQHAQMATEKTGEAVKTDAEKTGAAVVKTAEETKQAGDAGLMTTKVKTALDTAAGLHTKDINVDTHMDQRTITLDGSVPSEKEKTQAEQVAKGIAGNDFKVVNNLTIAPGK